MITIYKVENYRFNSESIDELFAQGNIYYLRHSKDGENRFLSTNDPKIELRIGYRMSHVSERHRNFLRDNFTYVDYTLYKNYREFKEKSNNSGWRRMKEIAEQSMNDNNYDIEDVRNELSDIRRNKLREKFIRETIDKNYDALNALVEYDRIENEELRYDVITNKGDIYEKLYENIDENTSSELIQIHRAQNTDEDRSFYKAIHSEQINKKPRIGEEFE